MTVPPLPITAVAICSALGSSLADHRAALWRGEHGLRAPTRPLPFPTVVGEVSVLPPVPQTAMSPSRGQQIAQLLISQIAEHVAVLRRRVPASRIGLVLGTSTTGANQTEHAYHTFLSHGHAPTKYDFRAHGTRSALLPFLCHALGVQGPAWVIATACTSSGKSLACAQRLILSGAADAVFVGGIDTLCGMTLEGFHSLGALSETPCRPFSAQRSGLNIGEGGALLLVEKTGDPVVLLEGVGESSDAHHISAPHPEGRGAREAMQAALLQGGLSPDDIDYVNAHGTGTLLNDAAEAQAITALLGSEVPVVSTKGYTGHLLGAAGGVEAVLTLLSITDAFLPASLGCTPVDPELRIDVRNTRRASPIRHAISNSFAFGGSNVSVLLGAP